MNEVSDITCFKKSWCYKITFYCRVPLWKENIFPYIWMINILNGLTVYLKIYRIIYCVNWNCRFSYIEKYVTIYLLINHNVCNFIFSNTLHNIYRDWSSQSLWEYTTDFRQYQGSPCPYILNSLFIILML